MALGSTIKHWFSLIARRFSRTRNLDGNYIALEQEAIPTVTMLAEWAKNDRTDISEMWVFGSATDHEHWNSLSDDLDVLMVVPDRLWTHETRKSIEREAPLSQHYLPVQIRVMRESECEPWIGLAQRGQLASLPPDDHKEKLPEYIIRHGMCVWRRNEQPLASQE